MAVLENRKELFLINLLLFLTFDLMLLGAGVRTMDAGLTCPDWPLCFGKAIPEYHFGVYLEFIHRAIAGLVSIVFAILFFTILKNKKYEEIRFLAWVGLFFLVAQVIMGGLTVLKLLDSIIVTIHLSLATVFLITLFFIKMKLLGVHPKKIIQPLSRAWRNFYKSLTYVSLAFVLVQIVLGGLVASTYSGLICVDFPTCNGQYFPAMKGPVAIQMSHRFGAYFLSFLISLLSFIGIVKFKKIGLTQGERVLVAKTFFLLGTQVAVGIMNLKLLIPPWLSVVHLGFALLIMLNLLKLIHRQAFYRDLRSNQ